MNTSDNFEGSFLGWSLGRSLFVRFRRLAFLLSNWRFPRGYLERLIFA